MNPVHILHPNHPRFTSVSYFHLRLDPAHVLQVSPPEPSAFLFFLIRATNPAQHSVLNLITLIVPGDEYNRDVTTMPLPVLNVLLENKYCKDFNR